MNEKNTTLTDVAELAHAHCIGSNCSTGSRRDTWRWTFDEDGLRALLSAAQPKEQAIEPKFGVPRKYTQPASLDQYGVGFYEGWNTCIDEFSAYIANSTPASNAQDAADAKRYRELRACNSGSLVIVEITGIGEDDWHVLTEDDADKAIDAALSAKEGEHG